jgi:predicted secreted protein
MANSDKNIRITTSKNKTTFPNIVFTGSSAGSSVITLEVLDDNTVSFTSNEGQVFSLDSNISTGTIWSVNDVSGYPLLRADVGAASGATIRIAEGLGNVGIGQTNAKYKLDVQGWVGFASTGDGSYTVLLEN